MSKLLATTFIPQPFEVQVVEADAVVHGIFKGHNYKRIANQKIVTEINIDVTGLSGLNSNKVYNPKSFKVLMPGGEWQGEIFKVSGTPKFKAGEEVVLMLKKSSYGFILNGLAAGKYKVIKEQKKKYLVSEVFANHPKFGKMAFEEFDLLVQSVFNQNLSPKESSKSVYKNIKKKKKRGRKIASVEENNAQQGDNDSGSTFWIAILLGMLGAFYLLVTKNNQPEDRK